MCKSFLEIVLMTCEFLFSTARLSIGMLAYNAYGCINSTLFNRHKDIILYMYKYKLNA